MTYKNIEERLRELSLKSWELKGEIDQINAKLENTKDSEQPKLIAKKKDLIDEMRANAKMVDILLSHRPEEEALDKAEIAVKEALKGWLCKSAEEDFKDRIEEIFTRLKNDLFKDTVRKIPCQKA